MTSFPALQTDTAASSRTGRRPLVTLSYAQSLDGSIAINRENSLNLSGPESLKVTHQLRASNDAILVGIGTVLTDNPRLTVRFVEGKNPRPVVLDSHLRLPIDANLLKNTNSSPLVATTMDHDAHKRRSLEQAGITVLCVPGDNNGWVDLNYLLACLADLGIGSLMVEGGARVITSFLARRVVDRLVITITPKLVGGLRAVENPLVSVRDNTGGNNHSPKLINFAYEPSGEDIIFRATVSWDGL